MKRILIVTIALSLLSMMAIGAIQTPVTIQGTEYPIPAIMTMPEGITNPPVVLMIHGFGSFKDEVGDMFKRLAVALAEQGYASLRFDFPGGGDHTVGFEANSIATQIRDARTVLNWLESQPGVDKERIGVVGFSLGGVVGSILSGNDHRVKALALWSTPGDMASSQVEMYEQYYPIAREKGKVEVDLGWRTIVLSREYFESRYSFFPLYDIQTYHHPLLIIAGENDGSITLASRSFASNAGSMDITLRIVPGADHIYNVLTPNQADAELVIGLTANWFPEKL